MRIARITLGVVIWLALGWALWWSVNTEVMSDGSIGDDLTPALWQYATGSRTPVTLELNDYFWMSVGDPIFYETEPGEYERVGEVTAIGTEEEGPVLGSNARTGAWVTQAEAVLYANAPALTTESVVTFYESEGSIGWIVWTMLPPEKREAVLAMLRETVEEHSEAVVAELRPIVEDALRDAIAAVEAELPKAIAAHQERLKALGARYQTELVEERIIPLVKEEILPIVREHGMPLANDIGQEIWRRVSVWRLGSRFLWDKLPGTRGDSLKEEWSRIVKEEATPVVEQHTDEIIAMVQKVFRDAARNRKVRQTMRESFAHMIEDEELHALVWSILKQAVFENEKLRETLEDHWNSVRTKRAIAFAGSKLEPTVIEIGNMLMGTRERGVEPEFAKVLRNRLLAKDRRALVLHPRTGEPLDPDPDETDKPTLPLHMGHRMPTELFVPERRGMVGEDEATGGGGE